MSHRNWAGCLRAGTVLGLLVVASAQANAGGFGIREQSAYGQGTSFAGIAAGGALSSMFWNPATMTQVPGIVNETVISGIIPFSSNTPTGGSLVPFGFGGTSNVADASFVPSGYTSYQFSPNLWLGLSINAPFGLSVNFPDSWAGRDYAGQTLLRTYNATPSIAYRINDWISVGAGIQIQYARASLEQGIGPVPGVIPPGVQLTLRGTGYAVGATAGVTLTPTPTTTIGVGWRSSLNQKIDGEVLTSVLLPATTAGSANTTVDLPDVVSLGIRQRLDPQWTLLGTVEWSNWSRIGTSNVTQPSGSPILVLGRALSIPFQYRDGWFFSGGAEYVWTDRMTVRGGIGYEVSPITDQVRTPLIPDNNRFWASIGASWKVFKGLHFDIAYSHLWVQNTSVNITPTSGNPFFNGISYVGSVDSHVDILSGSLVFRFDDVEPTVKRPWMN